MARYKFIADIERVTHSKNPNKSKQSLYLYVPIKLIKTMKTTSQEFSCFKKIGNCLPFVDGASETLKFILAPKYHGSTFEFLSTLKKQNSKLLKLKVILNSVTFLLTYTCTNISNITNYIQNQIIQSNLSIDYSQIIRIQHPHYRVHFVLEKMAGRLRHHCHSPHLKTPWNTARCLQKRHQCKLYQSNSNQ